MIERYSKMEPDDVEDFLVGGAYLRSLPDRLDAFERPPIGPGRRVIAAPLPIVALRGSLASRTGLLKGFVGLRAFFPSCTTRKKKFGCGIASSQPIDLGILGGPEGARFTRGGGLPILGAAGGEKSRQGAGKKWGARQGPRGRLPTGPLTGENGRVGRPVRSTEADKDQEDQPRRRMEELAVARRLAELNALGRLPSHWQRVARHGGVTSAVRGGRLGNSDWGRRMWRRRVGLAGGRTIAAHALEHLRRISPLGVRARLIAAERRRAQEQWEREHEGPPTRQPLIGCRR